MQNDNIVLQIEKINKYYGRTRILKDVTFTLKSGEFLVIFGDNGAGKSTLLKILAMFLNPGSGNIFISNTDIKKNSEIYRKSIGVVSHEILLYNDLTAYENLELFGSLYNVRNLKERIDSVLETVGLLERASEPIRNFSRGMQQRLTVARATLHDPSILLLDEPYTGLDQNASGILNQILQKARKNGKSAIITTHNIERGFAIADEIAILKRGSIVYKNRKEQTSIDEFKSIYQGTSA